MNDVERPLVSIIVPVFNVEQYLSKCLTSIKNQIFRDYELLLIDDGSTDASGKICDDFQKDNSRTYVVHVNVNLGVSAARNLGLQCAKGKYVTFIDSDDVVESDYLDCLIKPIRMYDCELVICGYQRIITRDNRIECVSTSDNMYGVLSDDYYRLPYSTASIDGPVCKLYYLEIIRKNDIVFPVGVNWREDLQFNLLYFRHVKHYYFVNSMPYNYYHRNNFSLSKTITEETVKYDEVAISKLNDYLKDMKVRYASRILAKMIKLCVLRVVKYKLSYSLVCSFINMYRKFNIDYYEIHNFKDSIFFILLQMNLPIALYVYFLLFRIKLILRN